MLQDLGHSSNDDRPLIARSQMYMVELIESRKNSEQKEERYDLFSSLLDANEDELDGQAKLADSELLGSESLQRTSVRVLTTALQVTYSSS